ncbi:MAG: DUF4234 domain-containing protein [Deltaproteobacteria bacterium]
MKQRSVGGVIVLSLITFGIYALVWHVQTKNEMNECGADIPTAWLLLVPIANIYWLWKWCTGIEHITKEKMTAPVAFLLHVMLPLIGMAILQDTMNKAVMRGLPGALPQARIAS